MNLKEISFKVHRPVAGSISMMASEVVFKLGLGPCGRFVESLESTIDYHGVTITQVSYPEDITAIRAEYMRLNKLNVSNMQLIVGGRDSDGKAYKFGYGNPEWMTPTKEEHEASILKASQMVNAIHALAKLVETKVFFYKLEDVRGRIVAISV